MSFDRVLLFINVNKRFSSCLVPCEPQNASAQLDCSTRGALVSWEASDGSNAYLVQAVGANGHHINCSSSSSNCSLPSMHCGQSYNITVTVLDGVCDSVYTQFSLQSGGFTTDLQGTASQDAAPHEMYSYDNLVWSSELYSNVVECFNFLLLILFAHFQWSNPHVGYALAYLFCCNMLHVATLSPIEGSSD